MSVIPVVIGISFLVGVYLLWKYGSRYFGVENRRRYFVEFSKDFPVFHNNKTMEYKKKLFEALHGIKSISPELQKIGGIRILEIGAGTGANLQFYPENTKLVVADPNPFFQPYLNNNLKKYPAVELERYIVTGAEDMKTIPSQSVDAVVSTLVLCSVSNIKQICKEVSRVLAPGGKFLFMEHVVDDKFSILKLLQKLCGSLGVFQFLFDGCRPDKDIAKAIKDNNIFASVNIKKFRLGLAGAPIVALYLIEPHMYGVATIP